VLYSHGTWSNYLAALATRHRGTPPVVWHIRNDHSKPATRWAGRALARWADVAAILAVSNAAAEPYRGLPNRCEVILNGVDYHAIERVSTPVALRAELGLPDDAVLVGFAGRLEPHKGIGVLLEAMREAVSRAPQLHLVVLGESARHAAHDQAGELRQKAHAWGIAAHVHLLGYIDGIESHLAALDVVSVPSICKDGCPRTAIESLALGIPLVGSDIGGIPEVIRDGGTGILVPPGDVARLAEALVALAASPELRRHMGTAAAADARTRFDSRRTAAAVANVLHQIGDVSALAARVPA
jgi:glycosyltransferase involved in cell wall biosynthesis